MKSGIYCIKNTLNGKLYVGSSVNLQKRKREHLFYLRKGIHHSTYLQRSYIRYGESNFEFHTLEYCEKEKLIVREQHYIDVLSPRYNMARIAGSAMGMKRSPETIQKLRDTHKGQKPWNIGIPQSEAQKKAHSQRMKGRSSGAKGKKWSIESRIKISNARKGIQPNNCIPINQYSLDGKLLASFSSVTLAEKSTGTKGIHQVLNGRCKTANNYLWKKQSAESLLQ